MNNRNRINSIFFSKRNLLYAGLAIMVIVLSCGYFLYSKSKSAQKAAAVVSDVSNKIKELNYSKYYNDDGTLNWIDGNISDYVTVCAYDSINLLYSDLNLEEDADESTINQKLTKYIQDYLTDTSTYNSMSDDFVSNQTDIMRYELKSDYQLESAAGKLSYGTTYDNIYDYYGMTKSDYKAYVTDEGYNAAALALVIESIFDQENMSLNDSDIQVYLTDQGYSDNEYDTVINEYGIGYITHIAMQDKVIDLIKNNVTLTKDGDE